MRSTSRVELVKHDYLYECEVVQPLNIIPQQNYMQKKLRKCRENQANCRVNMVSSWKESCALQQLYASETIATQSKINRGSVWKKNCKNNRSNLGVLVAVEWSETNSDGQCTQNAIKKTGRTQQFTRSNEWCGRG